MALDGTSGRSVSQIVISWPSCVSARWMAASAAVRSISRPLTGNLADLRTWSGTRTTKMRFAWLDLDERVHEALDRELVRACRARDHDRARTTAA